MKNRNIKIFCHSCEGKGYVTEKAYPSGKTVQVVCPECNGEGYVDDILYEKEENTGK
jgi:DnaJ-class molecular chaperone